MFDIMIIGAGAAGITAAITAKRKNDELKIQMRVFTETAILYHTQ